LPWRTADHSALKRLSIDDNGIFDIKELELLLSEYNHEKLHGEKRIRMVAISGASNVLGIYNDLAQISNIVHRYGAHLLVDAAQLAAHRKIDMKACNIDYLAFSGHKVYAPFGCGVLAVKKGLIALPSSEGNLIKHSGESNAAGIAALGKSLTLLQRIGMEQIREDELALTKYALEKLTEVNALKIYGVSNINSPAIENKGGVIAFSLKNIMPFKLAAELAECEGIGTRYGCHCAHITVKHILHVGPGLQKFQRLIVTLLSWLSLPGVMRISFGLMNSPEEVDVLVRELKNLSSSQNSNSEMRKKVKKYISDFTEFRASKVYAG
jgi:selenocysteine lyase/cysteine desulfurase